MSLEDFGARSWASLRELEKDDQGEVVCPVSGIPIGYSRGEIEIPTAHLADDQLRDALLEADVEHVRGLGYESPKYDVIVPETVGGPSANGFSSRMVGVRVNLGDGGTVWTPVRQDDLDVAERVLEAAHEPPASTDGSGAVAEGDGSPDAPDAHSDDESAPTRPAVVEDLGLPTEYPDGHPRYTYVGHCQADDVDVYAGRHGEGGSDHFMETEIGEAGWLGNPFPADEYTREDAVDMFMRSFLVELEGRPELREAVYELRGQVLGCWCHRLEETGDPDAPVCHADVIAWIADRVITRSDGGDQA